MTEPISVQNNTIYTNIDPLKLLNVKANELLLSKVLTQELLFEVTLFSLAGPHLHKNTKRKETISFQVLFLGSYKV